MAEPTVDYARLKAAYARWLECPTAQQETLVAALQAEDPALAQALHRRIRASHREVGLLDAAARETRFPRYRVLRELGRGGFGRVWLAERSDGSFQQQVAIKQLDRELWTAHDIAALVRERQILADLQHPHIARLLDGGVDSRGAPFLVTEFIDGERIDRWCAQQALDLRGRVRLLLQVCAALAHAHQRLVVHRDLKPANLMVDRQGQVRVLDFGIARLLGDEQATTAPDQAAMTLRYAAPEQIRGERVGSAADVYALGVVMYELLCGQSPYADCQHPAALLRCALEATPRPPSQMRPVLCTVPRDLDAICLRALRKLPIERYPSMESLAADLQRWLAGDAVQARTGERGYRARAWLRRRWPWLATAGLLLVFAGGHQLRLQQQLRSTAAERDRAQAVAGFFVDMFRALPPAQTRDGAISAGELLQRSSARLLADQQLPASARVALLQSAARVHLDLGQFQDADTLLARAAALLAETPHADPAEQAALWRDYGTARMRLGDMQGLYDHARRGLALLATAPAADRSLRLGLLINAVIAAHYLGTPTLTRDEQREALQLLGQADTRVGSEQFRLYNALGVVNCLQGRFTACRRVFQKLHEEALRLDPPDPDIRLPLMQNLATVDRDLGRYREAAPQFDASLDALRAHRGARDVRLAFLLRDAAVNRWMLGEQEAARAALSEARAIVADQLPTGHAERREIDSVAALLMLDGGAATEAAAALQALAAAAPLGGFERSALAAARCLAEPGVDRLQAAETTLRAARDERTLAAWREQLARGWLHTCRSRTAAHAAE